MAGEAAKALQKELKKFMTDPPPGLSASLTDNIFKWHALLYGPRDTVFEGGVFRVEISFPTNYPASPPTVTFLSKMFHPNVYRNGEVCMDYLCKKWRPTFTTADILNALLVVIADPNVKSPANKEASELYELHPKDSRYKDRVYQVVKLSESNNPLFGSDANKNYNL